MVKNHRSKFFLCAFVCSVLQYGFAIGQQLEQCSDNISANIALFRAICGDRIDVDGVGNALAQGADPACSITALDTLPDDLHEELMQELARNDDFIEKSVPERVFCRASEGAQDTALLLLDAGLAKDHKVLPNRSILACACHNGWEDLVQQLLSDGIDPNVRSSHDETPLGNAVLEDDTTIAQLLIEHGASVNAPCCGDDCKFNNGTALTIAAHKGHFRLAKFLINKGADLNHSAFHRRQNGSNGLGGWTPSLLAAMQGHWDIVFYLLRHGADANACAENGATVFWCAFFLRSEGENIRKDLVLGGVRVPTQQELKNCHRYIRANEAKKALFLQNLHQATGYVQQRLKKLHESLNTAAIASLGRRVQIPRDLTRYMLQKFEQGRES